MANNSVKNNSVKYENLWGGCRVVSVPVNDFGEFAISEKLYDYFVNAKKEGKVLVSKKALCNFGLDCLDASLDICYSALCDVIVADTTNNELRKTAYRVAYDAVSSVLYDCGVVTRRKGDTLTSAQWHVVRDAMAYRAAKNGLSFKTKASFRKDVLTMIYKAATDGIAFNETNPKLLDNAKKRLCEAITNKRYTFDNWNK